MEVVAAHTIAFNCIAFLIKAPQDINELYLQHEIVLHIQIIEGYFVLFESHIV